MELNSECQEEERGEAFVSSLSVKIPSSRECKGKDKDEDEDYEGEECKTPTCLDQTTAVLIPQCPPAPRKPKTMKRKAAFRRRVLLDLTSEVESLFHPSILGGKIKKARKLDDI
ncbi:Cyclin-dependent protein kinase [Actinidia chinensis var. chinensis]|uniref:Cyclin-dependent protein kinase n=1 Tax=Actinidia chinensis var. chinensis TaxID=1590841 RepID=A0A2R6P7X1_ACTCC|nr:Cyclin-dependent protein kinase [Actinidia chinensis var. chinensis]